LEGCEMSKVYMIRHGKPASTWGDADPDPGLDETGHAQARAAADSLLALPVEDRPTAVISSPLRRCRETAQPFADALGVSVIIDPRVGEIPTPKALTAEERPAWLKAAFGGLWRDMVGDMDYLDWRASVSEAVASYQGMAVFSHYVAINAVVSLSQNDDRVLCCTPDHTSILTFAVEEGRVRLLSLGQQADTQVL
jgi:broad specificity phosphatase PhoE